MLSSSKKLLSKSRGSELDIMRATRLFNGDRKSFGRIPFLAFGLAALLGFSSASQAAEVFSENFDGAPGLPFGWTTSSNAVGWSLSTATNDTPPSAMFVPESSGNSVAWLASPPIHIPTPSSKLRFRHRYNTSYYYNRGTLEISVAGGDFNDILTAGGIFTTNGYSRSYPGGWSSSSGGFITTEVYLPPTAAGQSVQLRWHFTTEYAGSGDGWYVDTVSVSDGLTLPPDDISVTVTDSPDPVAIGVNLTYLIKLTNTGPSTATAVLLTNILPAGVTLVSNTPSAGTCANINGTIVCAFGNLPGQSEATLSVVVQPTANGLLTNRVSIIRGEPDVYLLNNTAFTVTTVTEPVLSAGNSSVTEGDAGAVNAMLNVSLSLASPQTVTVNYATTSGSATEASDYLSRSGTFTFAPGETLKTVSVPILGDQLDEADETFYLQLANATNATIAVNSSVVTIVDDDAPPELFVLDAFVVEGNSGSSLTLFPVGLTTASGRTVSVDCYTSSGTASSPTDYVATNGTLVFPPGTTLQYFAVQANGDNTPEANEYFALNLQSVVNANWINSYGYGWILNDDGLPGQLHHFSWENIPASVLIGEPVAVTVTAKDYFENTVSNFTGTISFSATAVGGNPGQTILDSPVHTDSYTYPQTAGYAFTPNTNIVVTHVRHYSGERVSIWTDDGSLMVSQPVSSVPGTWLETALPTPVELSAGVRYRVTVFRGSQSLYVRYPIPSQFDHGTIDQGYYSYDDAFPTYSSSELGFVDLSYVAGSLSDLAITPTASGNFVAGMWSGGITPLESGSGVRFLAEDGQGHSGRSSSFDVLVTNDVALKIVGTPNPVGVNASLNYVLTVTNSGPSAATGLVLTNFLPAGVTFQSASASQGSWTNLDGLVVCNLGTLPSASLATLTISIQVGGIGAITNVATVSRAEPDFALANNTATVVTAIVPSVVTVDDAAVVEGNSGTVPMNFTLRLAPASGQTVTVNYATADDTATLGNDYVGKSGTIFFAPGQTNQTVTISVMGDPLNEADESFFLNLSSPTNAALGRSQAVGQILNDDPVPALLIYDAVVAEGNAGITNALFLAFLTAPSGQTVSASYYTAAGTAHSPADFIYTNGTLVFPPGTTARSIVVPVRGDAVNENTETFFVYISTLENATLGNSSATGFIVNDDGFPGQVHHFAWEQIASPQFLGEPMLVALTARDYFDNTATNFTDPVSLTAYAVTAETNGAILDSPLHSDSYNSGNYTLGYAFTPAADLLVTHVRHYFGNKVSIWTDDGGLLASQVVASSPGTWSETPLASSVTLFAGVRYRVGVCVNDGYRYWSYDGPSVFNYGTIDQGYYSYGDGFPQYYDSARWWFVDLRYTIQTLQPVAITPNVTTGFVGGQWAGPISVLQPGSKLMLRADDAQGHTGNSGPFAVSGVRLGIMPSGNNVLLHWPAAAEGYVLESAPDLAVSNAWTTATNIPATVGGLNVVTNPISPGPLFFRLRNP
jgi:uncharacterized repeat protein (TIGR01451 family)